MLCPRLSPGQALLQKTGLVDDQHRVFVGQRFQRVFAHDVAQGIRIPPSAAQIACWRHGPGSSAASARIQPVLRGSFPNKPSRNCPAEPATRFCVNSGPIRPFTSRNAEARNSSVVSTDTPAIFPIRMTHRVRNQLKTQL
jgi:hypothetical protein